jgi:hypothetical protein
LLYRKCFDPRCCQFNRERYPIQAVANLRHRRCILAGHRESGQRRGGPGGKQADGLILGQILKRRRRLEIRQGQRGHPPGRLPAHVERLAAGRQDADARAGSEQPVGQLGCGFNQVPAVIQQH